MSKFAVTLNYHGNYGYVEYDSENKKAEIVLGVAEAKAKVEKFLNEKLTFDVQEGDTVQYGRLGGMEYASGNDRKFVIERFLYLCYSKRVLKTIEHLCLGSSVG